MFGIRASRPASRAFAVAASLLMIAALVAPGPSTNLAAAAAPEMTAVPRNFALGAVTRQSSTPEPNERAARAAVDGYEDRVAETAQDANPWWEVDMGASRYITELKIWGLRSNGAQPTEFWVFLSPTPFESVDPDVVANDQRVTAIHITESPGRTLSIPVQSLARYVRVQIPGAGVLRLADFEALGPAGMENFATFGTATQSSTSYQGSPGRAIDGDAVGAHRGRSVSHTASENQAWWQVDLGVRRQLSEVRVWNRTDCCMERLSDFYVFASDQPFASDDPGVLAKDPTVATARVTTPPDPVVSIPLDRPARYVRVQLAGSNFLSLAEVEVLGLTPRNFAPGGIATQSSTSFAGIPEYAQDNNRTGNHFDRTVSHTANQNQPWWQVDLGASQALNEVRVWNRTDCCKERLSDFYVFASDQPFTSDDPAALANDPSVTTARISTPPDPVVSIPVDRAARYVRVQLAGSNYLSLGEVEVLGPDVLQRPDPQTWINEREFGMFLCYGMSTFDNRQWARPDTLAKAFDPGQGNPQHVVDTDAWLAAAQSAGMDYAVFTAKHHEGFALWPTKYSNYSIASSPYLGGNGDLVDDYVTSAREAGLKPGLYFSIWDRNNGDSTALIKNQIRELLTNYGEIDYLWFDALGRRVRYWNVSWTDLRDFIHQVSPNTIVANNDHRFNSTSSDILLDEFVAPVWGGRDERPLEVAQPMDAKTWYYTTVTEEREPLSADTLIQNLKLMQPGNVNYLLALGPRRDGTLDPRFVDRLHEVGERASG